MVGTDTWPIEGGDHSGAYAQLSRLETTARERAHRQHVLSRRWATARAVLGILAVTASAAAAGLAAADVSATLTALSASIGAAAALISLVLDPGRRAQACVGLGEAYLSLASRAERAQLFDPGPGQAAAAALVVDALEQLKDRLDADARRVSPR